MSVIRESPVEASQYIRTMDKTGGCGWQEDRQSGSDAEDVRVDEHVDHFTGTRFGRLPIQQTYNKTATHITYGKASVPLLACLLPFRRPGDLCEWRSCRTLVLLHNKNMHTIDLVTR
jgi:hypothetical protein